MPASGRNAHNIYLQKRTAKASLDPDSIILRQTLTAFMEEIAEPHRNFGIAVEIKKPAEKRVPNCLRNPGILYGLGNIVENSVDYAEKKVTPDTGWDDDNLWVEVVDDGRGFDDEMLARIGEPFVTRRSRSAQGGGLGLGLFIAKTLLERSGASLNFKNVTKNQQGGASVLVNWPRATIEAGIKY